MDRTRQRSRWSTEEDSALVCIVTHLKGQMDTTDPFWEANFNWKIVANTLGKSLRQCRERWRNVLDPNLARGAWTAEEDIILVDKYCELGPKWTIVASFLPGRTDTAVKNRFKSIQRRNEHMRRIRAQQARNSVPHEPAAPSRSPDLEFPHQTSPAAIHHVAPPHNLVPFREATYRESTLPDDLKSFCLSSEGPLPSIAEILSRVSPVPRAGFFLERREFSRQTSSSSSSSQGFT
eukprot:c17989_g1_i5.p1 GENE.c17989_g1_i5~~c17989_g1_i5.p1  ORF type:complete len:235 (+),score=28.24 c17989_g1_i5:63-767(+)